MVRGRANPKRYRRLLSNFGGRRDQYLFPSRFRKHPHLSTRPYARIVHRWVERAGLDRSAYGTHSMRRTKPAQIYKKTGNLRAVQLPLGHTRLESTVRYLGIEVDDALIISEQVELCCAALPLWWGRDCRGILWPEVPHWRH
jgi:site-specific recombinase XerD